MRGRVLVMMAVMAAVLAARGEQAPAATSAGRSGLLKLGSQAPDFRLPDVVTGKTIGRDEMANKALLVMFICRHCPYVQHVKKGLAQLGKDYAGKDVGIVAISANDPAGYAEDAPERLKAMALEEGFVFPYLFDDTQAVAKAYTAMATPDFFLFDRERRLVSRGQFDGTRPGGKKPATGEDLRAAIDAVLADQPVPPRQKASFGCSIKWKPGNEPSYDAPR